MAAVEGEALEFRKDQTGIVLTENGHATGFHYGGGWIVTAGHVMHDTSMDQLLIQFPGRRVIQPNPRTCFYFHVRNDGRVDTDIPDIAVFKIFGGGKDLPDGMTHGGENAPVKTPSLKEAKEGRRLQSPRKTYTLHFGGGEAATDRPVQVSFNETPLPQLAQPPFVDCRSTHTSAAEGSVMPSPGASGGPVFDHDSNDLVGVHIAGKPTSENTSESLHMNSSTLFNLLDKVLFRLMARVEIVQREFNNWHGSPNSIDSRLASLRGAMGDLCFEMSPELSCHVVVNEWPAGEPTFDDVVAQLNQPENINCAVLSPTQIRVRSAV
mmetsp:Transcript_31342/g.82117  ORF Transcript_31342/g.82117 Transcript_31342/m.82117 type:complete len:323 (-) Transcript_31342:153-1121(-)